MQLFLFTIFKHFLDSNSKFLDLPLYAVFCLLHRDSNKHVSGVIYYNMLNYYCFWVWFKPIYFWVNLVLSAKLLGLKTLYLSIHCYGSFS